MVEGVVGRSIQHVCCCGLSLMLLHPLSKRLFGFTNVWTGAVFARYHVDRALLLHWVFRWFEFGAQFFA